MEDFRTEEQQQAAIDAALRRRFEPPASVRVPEELLPQRERPAPHSEPLGGGAWGWRISLAAAAVLAGFLLLTRPDGVPSQDEGRVASRTTEALDEAGEVATGSLRKLPPLSSPDLELLYADATKNGEQSASMCAAPDELEAVRNELTRQCGTGFSVRPEAAGVLQGPFTSAEWPTGTVLTAYPEGPQGRASVLIAECEASLACCLDARLPEEGPLQVFSSRVGDLVLTEITPLDEPRLLAYFEAR